MKRADASPPSAANAGARSRTSRLPVAWLRMCSSSPMFRPCAARPNTSIGPAVLEQRAPARAELVAEEAQPLDRLVVADAEPQRPARALVQGRVRRADAAVLDAPTPASTASRRRSSARRGRARCRARARSRRAASSARGLVAIRRPALEHRRGAQRPPLRVADALPRDRRPGVQQQPVAHPGHDVARRRDRHRPRRSPPRSAPPPRRSRPRSRSPCAPHSRVSARQHRRVAAARAGASRPRRRARPGRAARRRRSRPEVDGLDACEDSARHGARAASGSDAGRPMARCDSTRWSRRSDRRPACSASATAA